ncbi:BON domain-containing protein [Phenylobacterium kunshanense]|uniref:BON domain-containing protein n=1 Tax=Phenylobacterium kunshanense TaxID=1445034 RepID=A0A328BPU4_9CAUL|nr:BON domain-containing protein [Phenylobacterium kunshanense]RAK68629.1 hypothetical protein DJ019_00975 [Phenylobacterium kunshanense]
MRRDDWRDGEREPLRRLRDHDPRPNDFGQADYSDRYRYDPVHRTGYRADDADGIHFDDHDRRRHRGPSDRVLWAVIMERLEDERRLDLSDVEVDVRHGEVFLDGTVRHKADKRRIEDIADIEGVRNVQNNLRPRERSRRWAFL